MEDFVTYALGAAGALIPVLVTIIVVGWKAFKAHAEKSENKIDDLIVNIVEIAAHQIVDVEDDEDDTLEDEQVELDGEQSAYRPERDHDEEVDGR